MIICFWLGIFILLISSVLVAKQNDPTGKKILVSGIVAGLLMIGMGFSAFSPMEEDKNNRVSSSAETQATSESESSEEQSVSEASSEIKEDASEVESTLPKTTSFNSDYQIESFLKENTKYTDISVSGTYVDKPFGAVITVNVSNEDDKRQVVSKILRAFYEHAGDKLDDFRSLSILVDDGKKRLKTEYLVPTIMGNAKVYRLTKVESLAKSWEMVPSPNK